MFKMWILILLVMLVICSITDISTGYINLFVVIFAVLIANIIRFISIQIAEESTINIVNCVFGMLPGLVLILVSKLGIQIGDGDAYVIIGAGFLSGLWITIGALLIAFSLSGIYGLTKVIKSSYKVRNETFPFVPFIAAGYVICVGLNIAKGRVVWL